jgi:hypothetical protein
LPFGPLHVYGRGEFWSASTLFTLQSLLEPTWILPNPTFTRLVTIPLCALEVQTHGMGNYDDHYRSTSSRGQSAVELMPIGIINEQNTCFLNSTFQAVSYSYVSQLSHESGAARYVASCWQTAERYYTAGIHPCAFRRKQALPRIPVHTAQTSYLPCPRTLQQTRSTRATSLPALARFECIHQLNAASLADEGLGRRYMGWTRDGFK